MEVSEHGGIPLNPPLIDGFSMINNLYGLRFEAINHP
jgi:hypothetical protein